MAGGNGDRNRWPGSGLCAAYDAQEPDFLPDGDTHFGAGNRSKYSDLYAASLTSAAQPASTATVAACSDRHRPTRHRRGMGTRLGDVSSESPPAPTVIPYIQLGTLALR